MNPQYTVFFKGAILTNYDDAVEELETVIDCVRFCLQ